MIMHLKRRKSVITVLNILRLDTTTLPTRLVLPMAITNKLLILIIILIIILILILVLVPIPILLPFRIPFLPTNTPTSLPPNAVGISDLSFAQK